MLTRRRYTYSKNKTVRAVRDPWTYEYDIEKQINGEWQRQPGGWGNPRHGYYQDKNKFKEPTLRGLLDVIGEL